VGYRSCGVSFITANLATWLITLVTVIHYCHDATAGSNGKAQEKVNPLGASWHFAMLEHCDLLSIIHLAIELSAY
jgi:hypothetical protein